MTLAPAERPAAPAPYNAARATHGGALSLGQMTPYEAWMFCESLAATPLLPDQYRKQPASILWAMEYGRALGLDVVTTITTIHVIKGKPTQSADLMLGRARSAGHRVRIKSERHRCVASIQRHDDPDDETVIEWTLDDAVTAGLCTIRNDRPYSRDKDGKPQSWEKYPRAMLRARAIAECVRSACPEVLHGAIYTPEELGAVIDQEGQPVVMAEQAAPPVQQAVTVVQSTVGQPAPAAPAKLARDYIAEASAATDADTVRGIWQQAKGDGATPDYLDEIAAVGRQLAAEAEAQAAAEPSETDRVAEAAYDGPRNGGTPAASPADSVALDADDEHAQALGEMYDAAKTAGLNRNEADMAFRAAHTQTVPQAATAAQLRSQRDDLLAAAGVTA